MTQKLKKVALTSLLVVVAVAAALPLALDTERRTLDDEARALAPGSFIDLTLGRVHYEIGGPEDGRLVVLVHGHGGTRHENGGFTELASMLAEVGIASVRMDFPGCGDSTEGFTHNNMTNMLQDVEAVFEFAIARPGIDEGRVGILGYSMGGRLAMLTVADEPAYRATVLWAPVALEGSVPMFDYFGGREQYEAIRDEALQHGSVAFTTPWGQEQQISKKFFDDLERSEPLEAIARYRGNLLVVHGAADEAVHVDQGRFASHAALSTASAELKIISGAGHGHCMDSHGRNSPVAIIPFIADNGAGPYGLLEFLAADRLCRIAGDVP